jgi:hypothetical protein
LRLLHEAMERKQSMTYSPDWPRCPVCGEYALDGHITCGKADCDEGLQRKILREELLIDGADLNLDDYPCNS